jgi:hypothetical protein
LVSVRFRYRLIERVRVSMLVGTEADIDKLELADAGDRG